MTKRAESRRRRITIDLDEAILSAVDDQAGLVRESRNGFIVASVQQRIRALARESVDAQFEAMGQDAEHAAELVAIDREMAPLSDAAWREIDRAKAAPAAASTPRRRRGTR